MYKNVILLVLLIPIFYACKTTPKADTPNAPITISLRKSNMPQEKTFSEMVKTIRLVPLEKNPECIIGRISQVDQVDGKIFVMGFDRKRGIHVFDEDGKYLFKFGSFGKGPGEYTDLVGFSFSTDLSSVYLAAADQKKVIEYSLEGELIGDINIGSSYGDIQFLNETKYISTNYQGHIFKLGDIETGEHTDTIKWMKSIILYLFFIPFKREVQPPRST